MTGLVKPFREKSDQKTKNSKNQSEIAASEQKTTSEKSNFCSQFSHSTFNLERKILRHKTNRFFTTLLVSA